MKRVIAAALIAGGMLSASALPANAATYSLIELVPLTGSSETGVQGINDNGDAVDNNTVWDGTTNTPSALPPLTDKTRSEAFAINSSGVAAGYSSGGSTGGPIATRWDGVTPTALNPLTGDSRSTASGINDIGTVVGRSGGTATKWDSVTNAPIALNQLSVGSGSEAFDINNNGVAVGRSSGGTLTNVRATRWDDTTPTALDPLTGKARSDAFAINDNGVVVGRSYSFSFEIGGVSSIGTRWDGTTATALNPLAGNSTSEAFDINNNGDAVGLSVGGILGDRAVLWGNDGSIVDLTSMLDLSGSGWLLVEALSINNLGQIGGTGINPDGDRRGFLLTPNPVPLPAGVWLLLSALGGLGFMGWRRRKAEAA